jgi:Rrf2 family protein
MSYAVAAEDGPFEPAGRPSRLGAGEPVDMNDNTPYSGCQYPDVQFSPVGVRGPFIGSTKMFSQTVEYALRTVVWLASQGGEPRTTQQIAKATKIPAGYLAKVLQSLGRAGLVDAQRGIGGGFTLAVSPDELTPLDVINAVDPIKRIKRCPLGLKSHSTGLCPLHHRLDEAMALIEKGLGETKISDLLRAPSSGNPFCE